MDWSTDRVIKESRDWTLDGDSGILQIMESMEKKMIEQFDKTRNLMQNMSTSLEKAAISLNNTTNKLGNMQHTQFIENLVKEDDEILIPSSVKKETVPEKSDPIQTLNKILGNNVKMLNNFYEKIAINLTDSDDEDDSPNVIYRPKNMYHERPLPYIFGSKDWADHWHVGLCDSDDNFSADEEIEEFSDDEEIPVPTASESDIGSIWNLNQPQGASSEAGSSTKGSLHRIPTEISENNENQRESIPDERFYVHKPKVKPNRLFEESEDEDSVSVHEEKDESSLPKVDLFNEEYNSFIKELEKKVEDRVDSSINSAVVNKKVPKPSPQIQKKIEPEIKSKSSKREPSPEIAPQTRPIMKTKLSNLFDDEPPDDDFDSLFGASNNFMKSKLGNTKPKSVNLFDDDVEEEDPESTPSVMSTNLPENNTKNLFFDNDPPEDDIFESITRNKESFEDSSKIANTKRDIKQSVKEEEQRIPNVPKSSIFDDNSEDEDNIFPSKSKIDPLGKSAIQTVQIPEKLENSTNVLNETTNSEDNKVSKSSIFDDFTKDEKTKDKSSEETEDDNIFVEDSLKLGNKKEHVKESLNDDKKKTPNKTTPKSSIFDDVSEDEDSIFSSKTKIDSSSKNTIENVKENQTINAGISENKDKTNLPKSKEKSTAKSISVNLFDETSDEESNLFANISKTNKVQKHIESKSEKLSKTNQKSKSSLFDDVDIEDEDDFLSTIKSNSKAQSEDKTSYDDDFSISEVHSENIEEIEDLPTRIINSEEKIEEKEFKDNENSLNSNSNEQTEVNEEKNHIKEKDPEISSKIAQNDNENLEADWFSSPEEISSPALNPTSVQPPPFIEATYFSEEPPEDNFKNVKDPPIPMFNDEEPLEDITDNISSSRKLHDSLFNDEDPPEDTSDTVNVSSKKPQMSMFNDDEPPEDTSDDIKVSSKEPQMSIFNDEEPPEDTTDNIKVSSKEPQISLFNDEPPDDEDFFATFPIPKKPNEMKSAVLFTDEPPEDDSFLEMPSKTALKTVFYDDIDETKSSMAKGVTSVADLIKKASTSNEHIKKKEPQKISKLNKAAININVSALLPGAKRIKTPIDEIINTETVSIEDNLTSDSVSDTSNKIDTSNKMDTSKASSSSDGLLHITKNRTRGMAKRRPSTRKGRQEMYKKGLTSNDTITEHIKTTQTFKPSETQKSAEIAKEHIKSESQKHPEEASNIFKKVTPKTKSLFSSSDDDDFGFSQSASKINNSKVIETKRDPKSQNIAQKSSAVKSRGLFSSDEEDGDLFSKKNVPKSKKPLPKQNTLFGDDSEDDEDLFGDSKKSFDKIKPSSKPTKAAEKRPSPKDPPKRSVAGSKDNPLADLL